MPNVDDFIGPPTKTVYDDWSPEQKAHFERALKLAEGIKMYHQAGGIGVAAQFAPYAKQLAERGGLTPEEATNLARFRMYQQGMPMVPEGPRAPADTPEQIEARRKAFLGATPQERAKMIEADRAALMQSHEAYFDSLVQPQTPPAPAAVPETAAELPPQQNQPG